MTVPSFKFEHNKNPEERGKKETRYLKTPVFQGPIRHQKGIQWKFTQT